jgi:hypothetical protein
MAAPTLAGRTDLPSRAKERNSKADSYLTPLSRVDLRAMRERQFLQSHAWMKRLGVVVTFVWRAVKKFDDVSKLLWRTLNLAPPRE